MEVNPLNRDAIQDLRAWFHPKDRSVYLAPNTNVYLNNGAYLATAFIAETALVASAASVTFSNIPQGFRHLMIMASGRSDAVTEADTLALRFNGDTGSNYDSQLVYGNSVTAAGVASRAASSILAGNLEGASSRAANFSPAIIFVFDYARAIVEKRTLSMTSVFGNLSADADMFASFRAGGWRNTNVITSVLLLPNTGPNFVSGSRFQLYGML